MSARRHIVSRHWTRENARKQARYLEHLIRRDPPLEPHAAPATWTRAGMPGWTKGVRVERAGRIRARWVVVAVER